MALKKSELYSSLWSSCDELRGGMDASQYKDYVLSFLFIKYVSDKYSGVPYAPIKIPKGADFAAMVALKGKSDIGDQINKKIIAPLAKANDQLNQADFPDFNDTANWATARKKSINSPTSSPFLRTRRSTFQRTAPRAMTSWAMRMSTSCAISPPKAAKARGSSILPPK
jgi:type I restriction-modification system DNA methylase subunit